MDRIDLMSDSDSDSESEARALKLLPTEGSEDRRDLLVVPDLRTEEDAAAVKTPPEDPLGWTLYLRFDKPSGVPVRQILERLTYHWRWKRNPPDIWGRQTGERWRPFAYCFDTEEFSEIAVTWSLIDDHQDWQIPTAAMLDRFRLDLEKEMAPLGGKVVAQPVSIQYAAEEVPQKIEDADRVMLIVAEAPADQPFDGRDIWDVMLSLGIQWGDMYLFHWIDPTAREADPLFSVGTTTEPGYFSPEDIAAGNLQTSDLVFEFCLPRCPAPEAVFEAMLKAATYAQQRLGGTLLNEDREPYDEEAARRELQDGLAALRQLGIRPGSARAIQQF